VRPSLAKSGPNSSARGVENKIPIILHDRPDLAVGPAIRVGFPIPHAALVLHKVPIVLQTKLAVLDPIVRVAGPNRATAVVTDEVTVLLLACPEPHVVRNQAGTSLEAIG
jgi:hypothetical protein